MCMPKSHVIHQHYYRLPDHKQCANCGPNLLEIKKMEMIASSYSRQSSHTHPSWAKRRRRLESLSISLSTWLKIPSEKSVRRTKLFGPWMRAYQTFLPGRLNPLTYYQLPWAYICLTWQPDNARFTNSCVQSKKANVFCWRVCQLMEPSVPCHTGKIPRWPSYRISSFTARFYNSTGTANSPRPHGAARPNPNRN